MRGGWGGDAGWRRGAGGARPRPPRVASGGAAGGGGWRGGRRASASVSACDPLEPRGGRAGRPLPARPPVCLPAPPPPGGRYGERARALEPHGPAHPTSTRTPGARRLGGVGGAGAGAGAGSGPLGKGRGCGRRRDGGRGGRAGVGPGAAAPGAGRGVPGLLRSPRSWGSGALGWSAGRSGRWLSLLLCNPRLVQEHLPSPGARG